ncbi:MAG: gliding motility-associated C-terminal domain-containing protein [Bacteroidetes bacterium]|nr:gliding motility-associated C-terminal domain-containing protein [Bacteroidota bacterium]
MEPRTVLPHPGARFALTGLLAAVLVPLQGQTVTNGSVTGPVGNSMVWALPGWTACSQPSNNSPDVLDMSFASWNGSTTVTPTASPDGGSWLGLANGVDPVEQECVSGAMTGLTVGSSYQLRFWGACFGSGPGSYANGSPVVLTLTIGTSQQEFIIPMAAGTWLPLAMCFTADATEMDFTMQTFSGGGYGSFDGFTVGPSNGNTDVLPDTVLCLGGTLLLDPGLANAAYIWQDGSTDGTFLVDAPGTYWVDITTACGTGRDTIEVTGVTPGQLDLGPDTTLCTGTTWTIAPGLPGAYEWQDHSTAHAYTVTTAGTYSVAIDGSCGLLRDTVEVSVAPPPAVDLGPDTLFCAGGVFLLDATLANASYHWHDGSTSAAFPATQAGLHWVAVTVDGCSARDSILLATEECGVLVDMPNIFSPNSDGHNDRFIPVTLRGVSTSALTIYNRWGQAVYETDDVRQGWDGRVAGTACAEGTYFWCIRYRSTLDVAATQSGHVLVVR